MYADHGFAEEVVEEAGFAIFGETNDHTDLLFEFFNLSVADLKDGEKVLLLEAHKKYGSKVI